MKRATGEPEALFLHGKRGDQVLTIDQKKLCLKMLESGIPKRQVYEEVVKPNADMTFKSFDKKRFAWKS